MGRKLKSIARKQKEQKERMKRRRKEAMVKLLKDQNSKSNQKSKIKIKNQKSKIKIKNKKSDGISKSVLKHQTYQNCNYQKDNQNSDYQKQHQNSDYEKMPNSYYQKIQNSDYQKMPNSDYQKENQNSDYQKQHQNSDYQKQHQNSDYEKMPNSYYQKMQNSDYQKMPNSDYQKENQNSDYQKQHQNSDYQKQHGYQSINQTGMTGCQSVNQTGYQGNYQTGYQANSQTGYQSNCQTGYESKSQTGYESNSKTGYQSINQTGYQGNSQTGYKSNCQTGYESNSQTGYDSTSQAGYESNNQTGYASSSQTGYQSTSQTGYQSTSQTGYQSVSQSGHEAINQTGYQPIASTTQFYVQGSFHQGSSRFGTNAGKQCVGNCLAAVIHSKFKSVEEWRSIDLDTVLFEGNDIYTLIHGTNMYLCVEDLPEYIELGNISVHCEKKDSITAFIGEVDVDMEGALPLDQALQYTLTESDNCFVTTRAITSVIIKQHQRFYLFDSHARNSLGLIDGNGSSLLLEFSDMHSVYQHFSNFVQNDRSVPFDITGMTVFVEDMGEVNNTTDIANNVGENEQNHDTGNFNEVDIIQDEKIKDELSYPEILSADKNKIGASTACNQHDTCSDVEIESISTEAVFNFKPSNVKLRNKLCRILKIPRKHVSKVGNYASVLNMGPPLKTKSIQGDGNCLFRAISCSVCQRQEYHSQVRAAVLEHMLLHKERFMSFTNPLNVEEHIANHRMTDNGSWGTAVEIIAAADLLQTDIFTYTDDKWIKYSAHQIHTDCTVSDMAIYLKHHGNHYEVVTNVEKRPLEGKSKQAEREKDDYKTNPEFRESLLFKRKLRYSKENEDVLNKRAKKYTEDEDYRENMKNQNKQYSKFSYKINETYKRSKKEASAYRYGNDNAHRQKVREASVNKYATDYTHKQKVREASVNKYATDYTHKQKVREASVNKYATDYTHKQKVREASIKKYATDYTHKQNVREASVKKYATDETHKKKVKNMSVNKYLSDEVHREKIKEQNKERRSKGKDNFKDFDNVIDRFRLNARQGPDHVCACCFRLFFENQVLVCNENVYSSKGEGTGELSAKCISHRYLHECRDSCLSSCEFKDSSRVQLWICYTCHRKLLNCQVPAECHINNLDLEEIPAELNTLNKLEQHIIALHIPFMKILGLPKGGQKGVHGPVVCVPSNLKKITSILPRSEDDSNMLPVKLKRKLSYKGYEEYQYVSTKRLEVALCHLIKHNSWYSNVSLDKEWLNPIPEETSDDIENEQGSIEEIESGNILLKQKEGLSGKNETKRSNNKKETIDVANSETCISEVEDISDTYLNDGLRGVQLDTCLQPADIGQEVLDQCFDEVFNISPAEGNKPVSVLSEEGIEAKSFPVHYPSGKNTLTEKRDHKLSYLRYFNLRLMSVENRFARDTSYIFFAQYLSELDRVISNVQIALRKETAKTSDGKRVTSSMLCNKDCLKDLLKNDDAIKYLKPVRGTPPYWQSTQKDIFAMIRQLGIPTFFCSFSSADFRWNEMTEIIMKQQGDFRKAKDLDWTEKCKVLNSNPVTLARMFEHRFHIFLHDVILSAAEPIGKVVDYFFRVEFQQRGSPHVHCLFWVEGAPKYGEDDDTDVIQFVDQYITCAIPDKEEDPELNEMVTSLHQHSKNHSKSCKKKGTICRFNFPRPPSIETFIAKTKDLDADIESEVNHAKQKLSEFWKCILDEANVGFTTNDVLDKVHMTQAEFEDVASLLSTRSTIVLKRKVNEIFINHYNTHLLRAWNANMDIQYVLDAYACVVYIISYISKAERELGLLLQQTRVEAQEGNLNAQQTMRKIGTAYLHHREISAQEAVFRVTGLKLKQCSRKVEFIPIGENPCRMSIPLKQLECVSRSKINGNDNCNDDEDDKSVWMTSRVDRFKERPNTENFETMCLARFCSDYDVLANSQVPQKINKNTTFKLGNDLGYIRKRTRTQAAVIRYPRFSVEASPEKYYQSILQLFLPYRLDEQLKPPQYKTYEEFYNLGFVSYNDSEEVIRVKDIVLRNKSDFVQDEQTLENAERDFEAIGCPENAWGSLCPEAEIERHECNLEGSSSTVIESDVMEGTIPDLNKPNISVVTNLLSTAIYPRNEIIPLLRTMNTKQRRIFYSLRDWCLQKAQGKTVKPFHVFITGGGGTGKSHLIKCLYYEMTRILSRNAENPDDQTVLLTAPTGTAAFNISGLTIHSALGIFKNMSYQHALLSEDKINTLRSKLGSLKVLIIDEISMVNKRMLFFIHQRLRQIKKMPEDCLYGGVSVVAVGDFYQLPPVKSLKSDKLYVDDPSSALNHLWFNKFEIVELDEIMRQRGDSQFSEILNRLRVKIKYDPIEEKDLCAIEQCIREGPENALHIFATNEEVKSHNNDMVMKLDTEVKLVEAEDFVKDKTSGRLIKKKSKFSDKDIQLPSSLLLAVGSRVMLIKNIDTKDGLVNGVMGTIREINQRGTNMPERIFIHFDNCKVGRNSQIKKSIAGNICIGLEPSTEDIPLKNGSRKQFPLQLSWACTIHKVQGMTVDECVVDLTKCFCYGQAYVALSRVTSLNGLYLKDIAGDTLRAKIFCDPDIVDGISKMSLFLNDSQTNDVNKTTILYHNIEGLSNHIEDLKVLVNSRKIDYICLTETWINDNQNCYLEGYHFRHLSRFDAYDYSTEFYSALKEMTHGGVGAFLKNGDENVEDCYVPCQNLESYLFKITSCDLIVATIYRTQKYELQRFLKVFSEYIERVLTISEKVLVCGDFNQDLSKGETAVGNFMNSKGFVQLVQSPTTESGTLIDHVYIKGLDNVSVSVLPTYYSYHEAICINFECLSDSSLSE